MRSAYEPCSRCSGYGLVDYGDSIVGCGECGGNCYVRARDSRGRFTIVEIPDPMPQERYQ